MPETDNGIVYHYCSLETFKSIIENKCLWLCDVQKSNDSAERIYFENIVLEQIDRYAEELRNQNDVDNEQKLQALQTVKESLRSPTTKRGTVYSCSFSCHGDQLSQWRGYGNDGYGVSLGFSKNILETARHCFRPVIYDKKRAQEVSEKIIKDSFRKSSPNGYSRAFIPQFSLSALRQIDKLGPFFKSEAFMEEAEYRLAIQTGATNYNDESHSTSVTIEHFTDWIADATYFSLSNRKFRVTNNRLSSYVELSFEKNKNNFIRAICLGPKCLATETDIQMFLKDFGYDVTKVTITPSKATYR